LLLFKKSVQFYVNAQIRVCFLISTNRDRSVVGTDGGEDEGKPTCGGHLEAEQAMRVEPDADVL
jgi:hypothetical protein